MSKRTFPVDTAIVLQAEPSAGSHFAGWTGACGGANDCNLDMDQAPRVAVVGFAVDEPPALAFNDGFE